MKKIVFLLTLFICQVGISQVLVSYSKGDNVDFSLFKTYQIDNFDVVNIPEFEPKKEGLTLLIEEIDRQMTARGYKKVNENPDLIINIGIDIIQEIETRETNIRDAPLYTGQRNYYWESEEIVVRKYIEGTVTLDMVSAVENTMIWQAIASGALNKKHEKNKKKIVRAVQKLFKKYPVKIEKVKN